MDKNKKMREIAMSMRASNISVADIVKFLENNPELLTVKYDLLCVVDDKFVRLPFDKANKKKAVGIFPFVGPFFIELEEKTGKRRMDVMEKDLPDEDIWQELFQVKDTLNAQLEYMGKPKLEGEYFARCGRTNMVVNLSEHLFSTDIESLNHRSKTRYCGTLRS